MLIRFKLYIKLINNNNNKNNIDASLIFLKNYYCGIKFDLKMSLYAGK